MTFYDFSFTYLIGLKIVNSLNYLTINYLTHRFKLIFSITLGNYLRILSALIDFVIVLTLLVGYLWECYILAYDNFVIGEILFIFICVLNWIMLARQDETIQAVFIVGILSMIVLIILNATFTYMGLAYREGTMPALMLFNGISLVSWLVLAQNSSYSIVRFAERIGDNLSWIDSLIGSIPHTDLALRNVCSFNLGLLNLTYTHTSGGAPNLITLALISLGLVINVLIGLRLIKISASVKLHNSFMLQIVKHGYSNITTIYGQLKNKQLPKATWYGWAIVLTMGVTFISPCYAMTSTGGEIIVDASLQGELPQEAKEGVASPVSEGASKSRGLQEMRHIAEHNQQELARRARGLPAEIVIGGITGGAVGLGTYAAFQSGLLGETTAGQVHNSVAEREIAIAEREVGLAKREAGLAGREAVVAAREVAVNMREQDANKASWLSWFKRLLEKP